MVQGDTRRARHGPAAAAPPSRALVQSEPGERMVLGVGGARLAFPYYDTPLCPASVPRREQIPCVWLPMSPSAEPFLSSASPSSSLPKPPQGLSAPSPARFFFFPLPVPRKDEMFLQRASWSGGRQMPLRAFSTRPGAAESEGSEPRGAGESSRIDRPQIVGIPKHSNLPRI